MLIGVFSQRFALFGLSVYLRSGPTLVPFFLSVVSYLPFCILPFAYKKYPLALGGRCDD